MRCFVRRAFNCIALNIFSNDPPPTPRAPLFLSYSSYSSASFSSSPILYLSHSLRIIPIFSLLPSLFWIL